LDPDYIIVGAGSAGCVLANRLTEDPRTTVLLIEAGPRDTHFWIHVPLGYGKLFSKSEVNWGYESEPEPALNGRRIFTPRGKVLGGSSSINGLVYMRGQPEDYDGWGVPGWDFASLLPYFRKAENQCRGADEWHGAGGPLEVSDLDRHELCDAFIASAAALGIPRNDDFNGAAQEGAGYYQATTCNGRRCSTATGYLRPAEKRANLRVRINTLATRIAFHNGKALGVHIGDELVNARREVILSGGAFN
jgi:choline dehydrogenase